MPRDFEPSDQSSSADNESIAALLYLRKASEALVARIERDGGEVPHWVQVKIREAALDLGMAVSYFRQKNSKEKA